MLLRSLLGTALFTLGCGPPPALCPCVANAPPKEAPTCASSAAPVATPADATALTCGQLALREARLVALGKGDQHPQVVDLRARLAKCADRKPTKDECLAVRSKRLELEKQYGPKHPEMVAIEAEEAVCAGSS